MEGVISMHFLDTHIVVWLFQKSLNMLSSKAKKLVEENSVFISPIIALELEYLYEIGKISEKPQVLLDYLAYKIGLRTDDILLSDIVRTASGESWTRDPFDRLIVAHARARDAYLITKDSTIRKRYKKAVF
jgi:PIN domain nuclease of toxin-antitoxin system